MPSTREAPKSLSGADLAGFLCLYYHYREDRTSSGHLYIIRIPGATREQCNEIITKMAEHGVATNVHYKPLPLHTAYKKLGFDIKDYPNAYAKFENVITLPLNTRMTADDVDYVNHDGLVV